MPFARRRDVQVLEDDRSEYLLQRTATIWMLFGQNKLKNKAAKPVQNHRAPEKEKKWALLVFRDLLQCLDRFLGRLRRFGIVCFREAVSPNRGRSGAKNAQRFALADQLRPASNAYRLAQQLQQAQAAILQLGQSRQQKPRRPDAAAASTTRIGAKTR